MKHELTIPLPMSVNRMYMYNPRTRQKIYKKEAREYLEDVALLVRGYCNKHKIKPVNDYIYLDMYFTLARVNSDSHNYKKLTFDALEQGGLVENDKYIMDRTQEIKIDSKNPKVKICFET